MPKGKGYGKMVKDKMKKMVKKKMMGKRKMKK
jgi:hypothetical protein